ncbi:AMP-binding protein [Actinoplanes utahensis]
MSAPTAHYQHVPMMSAAEAADVVCRVLAHRRSWWPWWARIGVVVSAALPRTVERALAMGVRMIDAVEPLRVLAATGLLRPSRLVRLLKASRRHGRSLATALAGGPPTGIALVDADGPMTYPQLDFVAGIGARRAVTLLGVRPGDRVGLACGGHRGLVAAAVGLARLGADVILLPPDLPHGRLVELLRQERISSLVHEPGGPEVGLPSIAWPHLLTAVDDEAVQDAADRAVGRPPNTAARERTGRVATGGGRPKPGRTFVLTSGTTGIPRAVSRPLSVGMLVGPVTTHLRLTPVRRGEPIVVATPPHHGYGLTYLSAGLILGAPVVLVPGGDPERILHAVADNRAGLLFALPIQLRRICELPASRWPAALGSLRGIVSGAAPLTADLSARLRERFGDRTFNMYATTEAGWAAMATPADLKAAPARSDGLLAGCGSGSSIPRAHRCCPGRPARFRYRAGTRTAAGSRPETSATSIRPAGCSSTGDSTT